MANTAANERQGAKRAGRLVSRALLVLGGAVAGTAAVWLVSGATASADVVAGPSVEVGTASVTPVTDATAAGIGDANRGAGHFAGEVAGGVADVACHQDATTWSEPQAPRSCGRTDAGTVGHDVSEHVSDSVTDLADDAVLSPAQRTLGAFEHIARKPQDTRQVIEQTIAPAPATDFGRQVWQLLDPARPGGLVPLPVLPGVAPVEDGPMTSGAGQAAGTSAVSTVELPAALQAALAMPAGWQHDDVTDAAGHARNGHRDLPSPLTPAQLPIAPAVPTAPGGTTAPGGHLDGFNFGVPFWTTDAVDTAVAAMSRAGLRHSLRTPGEQPGVTPD
ncbi:hypothetical protein AMES_9170 [Amycolatopsis mediterranei S699]|uniref:Uncharacterized protein n=2 Tax=Amycolatopsis mediterranei TaxID=33910 RepID=A0A0H3DLA1_AMYMU|nr:hypothetical protein [Amycolatopsis mediterranei]ADJ50997.1 hypothetical protein AMED_9309 [Amycolatopsis mediterranei U32]AEK48012.1 hypothetical protein RAM_47735 [Amycolatopsis mediterranei S699]AFO82702.1 hypothetical protein AMES_9170 [Amycolatopsis mediterranei S699]AGT89832.1 hypothetical protein B737_9172 [Amycolatopsis mediterranei RB]KDO12009.1 hypothetical protein DV26_02900 [Amycolatopsis mediterranei]